MDVLIFSRPNRIYLRQLLVVAKLKKVSIIFDAQLKIILIHFIPITSFNTGGPPLTRKSLTQFPLPRFLAYVCASGGFSH